MKLTVKDTCLAFSTSKYFLFFVFFLKWWEHDMGMQWKWSETGAPVLLFCRDYSLTWPIENAKTVSMFSLSYLFCFLVEEVSELRVNEVFGYLTERSQQTNFHSFIEKILKIIQKGRFKSCNLLCTLQHLDPTCFLFKFEETLLCQKSLILWLVIAIRERKIQ